MLALMSFNDLIGMMGCFGGVLVAAAYLLAKVALRNPAVRGAAKVAGKRAAKTALERFLRILAGK